MPTILITGANRGLGLEFARQFAADGWRVIATVRNLDTAAELLQLDGAVEVHSLDATDRAAIARLAQELKGEPIDVLLCSAGIYGPRSAEQDFGHVDWTTWHKVLETNVMGPMALVEALVENVAASDKRLIVMVSSQMGSMGAGGSGGAYMYRTSKAALNDLAKNLASDLAGRGITVISVSPGWVKTDMGGPGATLSPQESVRNLRALIAQAGRRHTGKFFNHDGRELAW